MDDQGTKAESRSSVPSIQITLTTFSDDENGELSVSTPGTVKIDGDDDFGNELILDFFSAIKSDYVRNLLLLSFGQFLLWMAFDTLSSLQSTLNPDANIGQVSLAVVYGALAISSFFLPTVVIKRLECKKTLVYATIGFCPYILSNFHTSWWTLIPSALLCGLSSGLLLSARSVYLNRLSQKYAGLHRYSVGIMNAWFFSVYAVFKQNTEIWGNLLTHHILKISHDSNEHYVSTAAPEICGSEYCGDGVSSVLDLQFPPEGSRFILVALFTALSLISCFFLAFFLEPLVLEETSDTEKDEALSSDFLATSRQMLQVDQIFLLPLSLYTGIVEGFYSGDYKRLYVACTWGFPHVATVSICHGVVSAVISLVSAPCLQIMGRAALFVLAAIAHLTMFLAMLLWKPDAEHTAGFFLIAGALGIGNGVWMSQLVALYGVLFRENEEAGFSCFYFLNSLGFLLAYSYSSYLCTDVKIYIPLALLVIGLLSYLAVEVRMVRRILFEYNSKRRN